MIRIITDQGPMVRGECPRFATASLGSEIGTFFTEASDIGLLPGHFPQEIELDGELLTRVQLDETGAGYRQLGQGADIVLTVFND